jgi:hypothetical protein
MRRLSRIILAAVLMAAASGAQAGIIFTPHLSEYARLPPGQYTEFTFIGTEIEHIYDRNGNKVELGLPFVPAGASTDAALALMKFLWIGNVFRDTEVPILNTHPQFCRVIGGFGYQQNTEQIASRVRLFGHRPGANGLMDLFGLCGIYGDEHQWGPLRWNGLLATTVKFPIGRYDTDAALNVGTNYWSVIPQFAFHADLWGRLIIDGTLAWQFNGDNDEPSFGGTTPTRIADWRNAEINFAWKFNEHWYADFGYSYRESVGPNYFDKVTVNFKDQPLAPDTACAALGLNRAQCDSPALDQFYLKPRPGPYADNGVNATLLTAGVYYIYRTSSVVQLRVAKPISGRGSQIDAIFDVFARDPRTNPNAAPISPPVTSTLYGVQEAAATSASPYLELRFVYLFWAP